MVESLVLPESALAAKQLVGFARRVAFQACVIVRKGTIDRPAKVAQAFQPAFFPATFPACVSLSAAWKGCPNF